MASSADRPPSKDPEAIYKYKNESGKVVYEVVRFPEKEFRIRRPLANGDYTWNLQGIERIPYHLEELCVSDDVFIVEGEKDVETLRALGFVATTNTGGSQNWKKEIAQFFKGKTVCVIPDADEPGNKWADQVLTSLWGIATHLQKLELPGIVPKSRADVSDWIQAGHTAEDLKRARALCPFWIFHAPTAAQTPKPKQISSDRPLPHNLEAERSVLGAVLIRADFPNTALKEAAEKLQPSDFFLSQNATLFREMLAIEESGRPIDSITLSEQLERKNLLEACGGVGYIGSLLDGVPRVSNVAHYAAIVREKAAIRGVMHSAQDILRQAWTGLASYDELQARLELMIKQGTNGHRRRVKPVDLQDFLIMDLPPVEWMVRPVLPVQGSAMIYAWRGKGKTFFLLTMGFLVATKKEFFGWQIENAHRVLYVDGEMPANYLQERMRGISKGYEMRVPERGMLTLLTPDLLEYGVPNIATSEGQAMIEEHLREGDLIILDNLSCLARTGKSQNDDETWSPIQDWMLRLRRSRITTVLVHHAGKGGTQRGTSAREDMLDTVIKLKEPLDYAASDGARFEVHFEKTRRSKPGDQVFPFELRLEEDPRGGVTWLHKPLRDIIEQQAAMLFADNMTDRDVMDALKLDRFKVYRLRKKYKAGEIAIA